MKGDKNGKRGKRITEIKIERVNDFPSELYHKVLLDIYVRKFRNGTLRIQQPVESV